MATPARTHTAVAQDTIRILIVEDEPRWQRPLEELYRTWFPQGSQTIVDNAGAARKFLRNNGADLVSLDLNLSFGSHSNCEPHGLKLLVELAKRRWTRALCVITQMHTDRHLHHLLEDWSQEILKRIKTTGHDSLVTIFGVNCRLLHKDPDLSPAENVANFQRYVSAEGVKALLQYGFTLTFRVDVHDPLMAELTCENRCENRIVQKGVTFDGPDAEFLWALASRKPDSSVTDVDLARIYGLTQAPKGSNKYTPVYSLHRRIKRQGMHGINLVVRHRATTSWRLNPLVNLRVSESSDLSP